MSKWRKPLKNQRRFDARYFLNERMENEGTEENSVQQEILKKGFSDFSFDSWLDESADKGTPEWSKPTEDTEEDPIDYDHEEPDGKIGGSVVEEEAKKRQDGLEELHVHAHAAEKPMSLPITDEKPPVKKKKPPVRKKKPPVKKEKLGPVHWDPPKNLEESETEES